MANSLTDPVLLLFIAGILASSFLLASSKNKDGSAGTIALLNSSIAFSLIGIISSAWTWVIHNSMIDPSGGTFCASEGFVQCGSVIGDPRYNNLFGAPWGAVGLVAFTAMFFLIISVRMDMNAKWSEKYTEYIWYLGLAGTPFLFILIGIEVLVVQHICPFCTIAHISLIGILFAVWKLKDRREKGYWWD